METCLLANSFALQGQTWMCRCERQFWQIRIITTKQSLGSGKLDRQAQIAERKLSKVDLQLEGGKGKDYWQLNLLSWYVVGCWRRLNKAVWGIK